ncbi:MAG: dipicolinate synthase subunit B [Oscillospiraceae bacterium]|nr:dipicolinate synthase subunit B [Oscillospiraceae bacterium]MBR4656857.1 dipicolinate synthase subunit B [Oscillospiraceae bacterium]
MRPERIGFAMTGSFCTFEPVLAALTRLCREFETVQPILSAAAGTVDSRFGASADFRARIEAICRRRVWDSLAQVEPIGPKKLLDLLIVAPCTGNTLAKLAAGIADTPVTLACKAHLRNARPVVLAPSTNDGLAANARSIGVLLDRKHLYFVPFGQDDPEKKPASLVADMARIPETVAAALEGKQIQPILLR